MNGHTQIRKRIEQIFLIRKEHIKTLLREQDSISIITDETYDARRKNVMNVLASFYDFTSEKVRTVLLNTFELDNVDHKQECKHV